MALGSMHEESSSCTKVLWLDELVTDRESRQLNAVVNIQLMHDAVLVAIDRFRRQMHALGNFLDAVSDRQLFQNFYLTHGKIHPAPAGAKLIAVMFGVEEVNLVFPFVRVHRSISGNPAQVVQDRGEGIGFQQIPVVSHPDGLGQMVVGMSVRQDNDLRLNTLSSQLLGGIKEIDRPEVDIRDQKIAGLRLQLVDEMLPITFCPSDTERRVGLNRVGEGLGDRKISVADVESEICGHGNGPKTSSEVWIGVSRHVAYRLTNACDLQELFARIGTHVIVLTGVALLSQRA